jgi:site-specific recombinase XerD
MLVKALMDYRVWIKSRDQDRAGSSTGGYPWILTDFLIFAIKSNIAWKDMFTFETLKSFEKYSGFKSASHALVSFSRFLFIEGRIQHPIKIPKPPKASLPEIYEDYLSHRKERERLSDHHLRQIGRILGIFDDYLRKEQIRLPSLKIEHLDAFMATFKVAPVTRRLYLYCLRGFLKYLYHEKRITRKDLASLLVAPRHVVRAKPPKFLRPDEVKKFFCSLKLSTPVDIRTYAIVHLVYSLGLRPVEISRITLDDVAFDEGRLTLRERKADNPITLPIPEKTLKAIAAYVLKARPQNSPCRHLFLSHVFPYKPMKEHYVIQCLSRAMKGAGLSCSGYWLRHTYAQNLLEMGRSIYEIKEMMGHRNIQSTRCYLHIDVRMMRKVLFDEEL